MSKRRRRYGLATRRCVKGCSRPYLVALHITDGVELADGVALFDMPLEKGEERENTVRDVLGREEKRKGAKKKKAKKRAGPASKRHWHAHGRRHGAEAGKKRGRQKKKMWGTRERERERERDTHTPCTRQKARRKGNWGPTKGQWRAQAQAERRSLPQQEARGRES